MKNSIALLFFCGTVQIISGNECPEIVDSSIWGGRRIRGGTPLAAPVRYVVIHNTGTPRCTTREECARTMRQLMDRNTSGTPSRAAIGGFSFVIGGDGLVYRVRGWDLKGAHAPEYNERSIGVALIGRFENSNPTREQLRATKKLIECGVRKRKLKRNHRLIGHLQIATTVCPGNMLYKKIKEWPNWYPISDDVEDIDF